MRQTKKDKRIFSATRDYYFEKGGRVDKVALHITGRKLLSDLTPQEKTDIQLIKSNMEDRVYMGGLVGR